MFKKNGDRQEGDFKNDKRERNGIMYYFEGHREMGDYKNDKEIGKHVLLTSDGKVEEINF